MAEMLAKAYVDKCEGAQNPDFDLPSIDMRKINTSDFWPFSRSEVICAVFFGR